VSGTLGIDVGGTNTKLVHLGPEGPRPLEPLPTRGEDGPEDYFARLATRIQAEGLRPEAIGLAFAGLVDLGGRVIQAPNLARFEGVRPQEALARSLPGVPVVVDNDVNAMLRGEQEFGAARGARNALMLGLGTGVGGAILLEGHLFRGETGVAGELGHTLLDHDGPPCTCGLRGHVEAYLSTRAIGDTRARGWRRRLPRSGPRWPNSWGRDVPPRGSWRRWDTPGIPWPYRSSPTWVGGWGSPAATW